MFIELHHVLQVTSEQLMLVQANFVDQENQWKEEKHRLEVKVKDILEKHEYEMSEKELQIQTLRSSLSELESAYSQAASQYNALQVCGACLFLLRKGLRDKQGGMCCW